MAPDADPHTPDEPRAEDAKDATDEHIILSERAADFRRENAGFRLHSGRASLSGLG
jgi:hypothetical protein